MRGLWYLVVRASVDKLFVYPNDPRALLIMFYDASQFGFAGQVLLKVSKLILVNSRNPVDASVIRYFK